MRTLSAKQYAESLIELSRGKSEKDIDSLVNKCIHTLARQGKAKVIHQLSKEVQAILDKHDGVTHITVVLADKNVKNEQDIMNHLQERFGKEAEIDLSYDPTLIGGMVMRVNDTVVDASISYKFAKLRATLQS